MTKQQIYREILSIQVGIDTLDKGDIMEISTRGEGKHWTPCDTLSEKLSKEVRECLIARIAELEAQLKKEL